jgi:AAA domain-containing protein
VNVVPIAGAPAQRPDGLNIIGARELGEPLPVVRWLCQSLRIAPGAPTLFSGYGYSGKSVALQSLALSVASGAPLWGGRACARGRVLHLDYEQGRRITADRYQRMAFALDVELASLEGWLECGILPTVPLTADLLCRAGENRTLVEIDSWRAAHPSVDENSSEVRKTLDAMGLASEKTGCTFATLSHARKPPKDGESGKMVIRGSSGFYDGCQTVYVFDGTVVGAPTVKLEKDRIGGIALEPFRLLIEDTHGGRGLSVRAEAPQVRQEPSLEDQMAAVAKYLIEHPEGVAGVELLAEKVGIADKRTRAIVDSLEAGGTVARLRVKGVRGNACRILHSSHVSDTEEAPF